MNEDDSFALRQILQSAVDQLYPHPRALSQRGAARRLDALATASPKILCMLAEPWMEELRGRQASWEVLCCCALLHLYARVLDDAVDENLPCHRKALLKAQPLYWRAVFRLGRLSTLSARQGEELIEQTIGGVLTDDEAPSPENWGVKNHHLLLVPLLLSDGDTAFEEAKNALSVALRVFQASEELEQGSIADANVFIRLVLDVEHTKTVEYLATHGWQCLAWHMCSFCRLILERL